MAEIESGQQNNDEHFWNFWKFLSFEFFENIFEKKTKIFSMKKFRIFFENVPIFFENLKKVGFFEKFRNFSGSKILKF